MKKVVLFYSLLFFAFLSCCTNENRKVNTVPIMGKLIPVDSLLMKFPYRINCYGSKYIALLDLASDSCFYHILSYPQMKYLYSIGHRGEGPEEIILPTPFYSDETKMWILDGARSILREYSPHSLDTILSSWNFNLPLSIDFVMRNDSTALIEDMSGRNRLIWKSNSGCEKSLFSMPKKSSRGLDHDAYLWRSFMAYNGKLDKLALASQFGDVIEIYNIDKNDSLVVVGSGGMPREDKQIEGFHDIKWKGDSIFALYSGRSRDELASSSKRGQKQPNGGNVIKVFSSDGSLLMYYTLNYFINGFMIKDNQLIGITSNEDTPLVVFTVD